MNPSNIKQMKQINRTMNDSIFENEKCKKKTQKLITLNENKMQI